MNRITTIGPKIAAWLSNDFRNDAVNQVHDFGCCIASTVGLVRKENQDRAGVFHVSRRGNFPAFVCFVISDGMGGMKDGARCANIAVAEFVQELINNKSEDNELRVKSSFSQANKVLYNIYSGEGGATLSALIFFGNGEVWLGHVGDSRIYIDNGFRLERLTTDDNLAEEIKAIKGSRINFDSNKKMYSQLSQYMGVGEDLQPHIHRLNWDELLLMDDSESIKVFLTTDGAHAPAEPHLADLCKTTKEPAELCRRLTQWSRWVGGRDNATVVAFSPRKAYDYLQRTSYGDLSIEAWGVGSHVWFQFLNDSASTMAANSGVASAQEVKINRSKSPKKIKGAGVSKKPSETKRSTGSNHRALPLEFEVIKKNDEPT